MKKNSLLLLALVLTSLITTTSYAQNDDALVRTTLLDYLEGGTNQDTSRLNRAFSASVVQMSVGQDNRLVYTPKREFMSKVRVGQKLTRTTRIVSYSIINGAATATVESEYADFKYVDYLTLLKIGPDWKIVSRVFARAEKDQQPTSFGGAKAPVAGKKPVAKKSRADDGWN